MKSNILKLSLLTIGFFAVSLTASAQEGKKKLDPEKVFNYFDLDKDGKVTFEEFKSKKRKNELSDEILQKRFNRIDKDGDGSYTLEDYKARLEREAKAKAKKKKH